MEQNDPRNEFLTYKLIDVFDRCQEQVSKILDRGISPNSDINLEITKQQERDTWKAFLHANEYLTTKFFQGEARLTNHPLYLIPHMIITTDIRDEYYKTFKSFNEYLTNFYGYIATPKTIDVLRKILDRVNILAMHYSRLCTMREMERIKI